MSSIRVLDWGRVRAAPTGSRSERRRETECDDASHRISAHQDAARNHVPRSWNPCRFLSPIRSPGPPSTRSQARSARRRDGSCGSPRCSWPTARTSISCRASWWESRPGTTRGFTHSLAAGLVLAAVVWLFAHRSGLEWSALRLAGAVCVLWGSHVVLDSLTVDLGAPFGVPMLWPFSSDHVHLANMFVHAQKTNGRVEVVPWLLSLFSRNNIGGSVLEVVIVAPPAIALWLWRFRGAVLTRSGVEPGVSPRPPRRHSTGSADEG